MSSVTQPSQNERNTLNEQQRVLVAAGVIIREVQNEWQVLLAKRAKEKHQGGLWEFPGGKVEASETEQESLNRELNEELNIQVVHSTFYHRERFDYPDKLVQLSFFLVTDYAGEECGAEGQQVEWVGLNQLSDYQFPQANLAVVNKLQDQFVIS
jgi:8-oxo-dGTP diphosphatase